MNRDEKTIARILLELKILKADGQLFEDLFVDVMTKHNPNFFPVKPQGSIGDRKNDGFDQISGKYYQVYAPEDLNKAKTQKDTIEKIENNFSGLLSFWQKISPIIEFFFVINDKFKGVFPTTYETLSRIKNSHNLTKCEPFLAKDLANIVFTFEDDEIQQIVGFIPNPNSISREIIDYSLLNNVISHILANNHNHFSPSELNVPDFIEKIRFNQLEKDPEILLQKGSFQLGTLDDYFANNDPEIKVEIRDILNSKYNEFLQIEYDLSKHSKSTWIFYDLLKFITSETQNQSVYEAGLVIMAKYFDTCDIFEYPN